MDPGTDLTYDLRWFLFSGNLFKPEPSLDLATDRQVLRSLMPCLVQELEGKAAADVQVRRDEVRGKLKRMGFYSGKHLTRPDNGTLDRDVVGASPSLPRSSGVGTLDAFVYTDPTPAGSAPVTEAECLTPADKRKRQLDCVHSVGRKQATTLAKQRGTGGAAIGISQTSDEEELWAKLSAATRRSKVIRELHIFGHGLPDVVQVGGGRITPSSRLPQELWCWFAKDANIFLYGCLVGALEGQTRQIFTHNPSLMDWFGNALLCRGGTVTSFSSLVNSKCGADGLVLSVDHKAKVPKSYAGCDPAAGLRQVLKVLDKWLSAHERLD